MLIKYILNALFKSMGEQKDMVTMSEPDFNNIKKASQIMMGIITEFLFDGRRSGIFVLDGIWQAGKPVIC